MILQVLAHLPSMLQKEEIEGYKMDWSKSRLKIVLNIVYETRSTRRPRDEMMRVLRRIHLFIFLLYKL